MVYTRFKDSHGSWHRGDGAYARAPVRVYFNPHSKRWHSKSGRFRKPPKPYPKERRKPTKKVIKPLVERVTVGTGISVQNRSGRGLRLSFTWVKVVPRVLSDEAVREGEAWIRERFGVEAGKLSRKYLKEWGLEEMDNFNGYNVERTGWDVRDLGKMDRSWVVNGKEHREGEG